MGPQGILASPLSALNCWVLFLEGVKYDDASPRPPSISSFPLFLSAWPAGLRMEAQALLLTCLCLLLGGTLVHLGPSQTAQAWRCSSSFFFLGQKLPLTQSQEGPEAEGFVHREGHMELPAPQCHYLQDGGGEQSQVPTEAKNSAVAAGPQGLTGTAQGSWLAWGPECGG